MKKQYTCHTDRGKWNFEAYNDKDALRLALFYCWRDDEDFIKVEGYKGFIPYTLCLCKIDKSNLPTFEF